MSADLAILGKQRMKDWQYKRKKKNKISNENVISLYSKFNQKLNIHLAMWP